MGCNQNQSEVPVHTADGSNPNPSKGDGKITHDVPPLFSESQLKAGQRIEWQTTTKTGSQICIQWIVTGSNATGITIESRYARKCLPYDDSHVEHIKFDPDRNGLVTMHIITQNGETTDTKGSLTGKSIFDFIYGHSGKVEFLLTQVKLGEDQYDTFRVKNRLYYNKPGHAFHAFVLTFQDADSNQYQFKQSDPAIEALPKTP